MGSYTFSSFILSVFLLATLVSSSPFISEDIFENNATSGRALLQQDKKGHHEIVCGFDSSSHMGFTFNSNVEITI
ncbi:hypothetical protein TSUD_286440 [Trifolium subterraneum]|uniref:Legume lectin domain-containing protein n=1 Tax=Trifolium subterraneum TaxID=3900 RepID=A0A2Z6PIJ6_TRISU|nr:hypothetical protein TSUD_286440 [Trifolium subterraneum]